MDTLEALLIARAAVLTEIENAQGRLHDIGQAIEAWMQTEGAQERVVADWKVTYRPPDVWERDWLMPLLEAIPQELLVARGAYIPAHIIQVAAAWNMTKVKPLARYSAAAARIIESARSDGFPILKIEERTKQ